MSNENEINSLLVVIIHIQLVMFVSKHLMVEEVEELNKQVE